MKRLEIDFTQLSMMAINEAKKMPWEGYDWHQTRLKNLSQGKY